MSRPIIARRLAEIDAKVPSFFRATFDAGRPIPAIAAGQLKCLSRWIPGLCGNACGRRGSAGFSRSLERDRPTRVEPHQPWARLHGDTENGHMVRHTKQPARPNGIWIDRVGGAFGVRE
jgi:hypothetical protein